MSEPVEITDANFADFVKEHQIVVVDCWAAWCAPCRMLSPVIHELAQERTDVKFAKLDVDKNRSVPMKYGIMSIPTLLVFKNGKLVDQIMGARPREKLEPMITRYIG